MVAIISTALSVAAILFSLYTWHEGRRRDRRDLFLKVHELMISEDRQWGRELLFRHGKDRETLTGLSPAEFRAINRALATYNALGMYLKKKYVNEGDVMDMWAQPIVRAWHRAEAFVAFRSEQERFWPWPHFAYLASRAEAALRNKGIEVESLLTYYGEESSTARHGGETSTPREPSGRSVTDSDGNPLTN